MMFPECRRDDYYNQDFLNGTDQEFIRGFDWCVEMAVDNFFDNDMDELSDSESYLGHILSEKIPELMQEEYDMEFSFPYDGPRPDESRKVETYADLIRYKLLDWIERERDQLITSMIDNMDEDIYKALRNKVLKDNAKSDNPKEYYDTRKFAVTGKKQSDGPGEDDV